MWLLLCGLTALGAPVLELVQTAPVETTLEDEGLRHTAEVWLELVQGASERIDLSHFYVHDAPPSRLTPVLDAIRAQAAAGVEVRLLADAKFQKTYPDLLASLGALDNIEVRLLDLSELTGGVQHAKYMLVDGERLYLGSANFDWRSLEHIQELGIHTDEPHAVEAIQAVFDRDWRLAGGEPESPAQLVLTSASVPMGDEQVVMTAVASPTGLLPNEGMWDLPRLQQLFDGARERVRIQLLSFATRGYDGTDWYVLDAALRAAAARGVAVELLVADWNKARPGVEAVQALAAVEGITVKFVSLPEYSGGFIDFARVIHSKFVVVDGEHAWLGTSNFSRDYFHSSRNVGVVVHGAAFAGQLDELFARTWDSAYTETVDPDASYTPPRRK